MRAGWPVGERTRRARGLISRDMVRRATRLGCSESSSILRACFVPVASRRMIIEATLNSRVERANAMRRGGDFEGIYHSLGQRNKMELTAVQVMTVFDMFEDSRRDPR